MILLGAGCTGGAGGSEAAFCDAARDRADVFSGEGDRRVEPGIVGAARDLADEAPDDIREQLETIGEASSDEEVDRAFAEVKDYLRTDCDITLE